MDDGMVSFFLSVIFKEYSREVIRFISTCSHLKILVHELSIVENILAD